jgi:hypothetical protein
MARMYRGLVWIEEMSASEPLMTYREELNVVETEGAFHLREKSARRLITAWATTGI